MAQAARLESLTAKLAASEGAYRAAVRHSRLIKDEVGEADVARVISKWTGIPVSKARARGGGRRIRLVFFFLGGGGGCKAAPLLLYLSTAPLVTPKHPPQKTHT